MFSISYTAFPAVEKAEIFFLVLIHPWSSCVHGNTCVVNLVYITHWSYVFLALTERFDVVMGRQNTWSTLVSLLPDGTITGNNVALSPQAITFRHVGWKHHTIKRNSNLTRLNVGCKYHNYVIPVSDKNICVRESSNFTRQNVQSMKIVIKIRIKRQAFRSRMNLWNVICKIASNLCRLQCVAEIFKKSVIPDMSLLFSPESSKSSFRSSCFF